MNKVHRKFKPKQCFAVQKTEESVVCVFVAAVVSARDEVEDGDEDKHTQHHAPEALQANDDKRSLVDISKDVLFHNNLDGLDDLREHNKHTAKQLVEEARVFAWLVSAGDDGSSTDKNKSEGTQEDTEPLEGKQLAPTEEDSKASAEDNHTTTEHLHNGDLNIDKTSCHESGS